MIGIFIFILMILGIGICIGYLIGAPPKPEPKCPKCGGELKSDLIIKTITKCKSCKWKEIKET